MIPRKIKNYTQVMLAPSNMTQTECKGLAVRVEPLELEAGIVFTSSSAWEPTPKELEILNAGGSVVVSVVGQQPPMFIFAEEQE
jgi:hypothetical protein